MKILFVAHERNMGGASKSLVTLAKELQERGNEVMVVLPIKNGQVYRALLEKKIPVKRIFFGWWMMPVSWNPLMKAAFRLLYACEGVPERRIAALARRFGAQIVHSNSSAIDVGARAAKRAGIMHVWHFREFGDADYHLEYLKGKEESCRYLETVPGKAVFISESVRDAYQGLISPRRGCVIYNGIAEQFLHQKYMEPDSSGGDNDKKITFLIAGNLHPTKRQDLVLAACRILEQKKKTDMKMVIAGAASAMKESRQYEKKLHEMAAQIQNIEVVFTGFVQDMAALRKETDVELVCSEKEAFGRVTIEAMMSSNPVIASDSGANPELIHSGENGLLFSSGDAQSLAECMQKMLEEPGKIRRMGCMAYTFAATGFPSERNTKQIEELYRELLQER